MKIRVALLLLFVVFSHANSVSAECAWILWQKVADMQESSVTIRTYWSIYQSHATLAACEKFLKNTINGLREGAIRVGFHSRGIFPSIYGSKGSISICDTYDSKREQICISRTTRDYICLPDTVDPREQKQ